MPNLKKNFFYSALLTVANYVFPLITYPYVSRVLGVANIGICNYVDGIVNYFIMFSMMGIATVGVREIAAAKSDRLHLNRVFSGLISLNAATSLLAAVVLAAAIFLVPALAVHKELMGIGVLRLLANFLCMEWLFKGLESFRYITVRSVLIKVLYMAAVFVFVRKPDDYDVYYLLLCLTIVANALVNVLYSRHFVSLTTKGVSYGTIAIPFFLIGLYVLMSSMYTTFNVIYLGYTSSEVQVGYYTSATKIFGMIIALFSAFTAVMLPRMSAVLSEGRDDEFWGIVTKVLRVLFCGGVPIVLLMEAEAADIIRIISGPGYEGAITPMRIISPLILIIGMEQVYVLQTMMPKKYDREVLFNSIIGAVVGVTLNVLLVRSMEAIGSSIVWLLSEMTVLGCSIFVVTRKAGVRFPFRILMSEVLKCLPLGVLLVFIPGLPCVFYVRFILASVLTVVYFFLLNLVFFPNPDVVDCLKSIIPRRWWAVLHQLRSHMYLLRVVPFSDALFLIVNRMRYGFETDPDRRYALNNQKHARIIRVLRDTVGDDMAVNPGNSRVLLPEKRDSLPIWVCWLQGEESMPELNQVCVRSIRAHAGTHPVVFLSGDIIHQYIDIPACIAKAYDDGTILPAIYSDYVRCALLAQYGGVWLDSTILLTDMLGEEWFSQPFMSVRQDNPDNDSVSRYRWASFCLGAVPGSFFFASIERMFRVYFEKKSRNVDYLMIDYFFELLREEDPDVVSMMDRVPCTNPAMHRLRSILNEPFNPDVMSALTLKTSLFKLTYKMELREASESGLTFWGFLKQKWG